MEAVVDLNTAVSDFGFPAGAELLRFATAANRAANSIMVPVNETSELVAELDDARGRLIEVVGSEGLLEAAATVAAFNGLVRVADGTGIELDGGLNAASTELRSELKLDELSGAANTRSLRSVSADEAVSADDASADSTSADSTSADNTVERLFMEI